jgi:5-(carboxyamino)imidazole ribonucleotide synthase
MRIGIIGAGQLGQMLGIAARDLGVACRFLDPADNPPAATTGPVMKCAFDDTDALARLAAECDVVTYEFENVAVEALREISALVPVYPPIDALRQAQDRLVEKQLFRALEIPLPDYCAIDSIADLEAAVTAIGLPLVIKTRRMGYDGKGQFLLERRDQIDAAWQQLGGRALIAEQWVPFDFEISAIGVRNVDGEIAFYPLTRNEHTAGILRQSRAPVEKTLLVEQANHHMRVLLEHLNYVGVLALELFVVGDKLLANEFAPRVHNSGHWTIEGSETSQFTNHLRAIMNMTPGPTAIRGCAGMLNLIGYIPATAARFERENCYLHDYGKAPKPDRKLGHITVVANSTDARDALMTELDALLTRLPGKTGPAS